MDHQPGAHGTVEGGETAVAASGDEHKAPIAATLPLSSPPSAAAMHAPSASHFHISGGTVSSSAIAHPESGIPEDRRKRFVMREVTELPGSTRAKRIYKSYDVEEGIEVAMHIVPLGKESKDAAEAKVAALVPNIEHESLLRVVDHWLSRDAIYFITPLGSAGTMELHIERIADVRFRVLRKWCRQILAALSHIHASGLVHGDVHLSNMYIKAGTGDVLLGTFAVKGLTDVTVDNASILREIRYAAPEACTDVTVDDAETILVAAGFHPGSRTTPAMDIYSFGMCLLEIVTRKPPYSSLGDDIPRIIAAKASGEVPIEIEEVNLRCASDEEPEIANAGIGEREGVKWSFQEARAVKDAICKCLEKDPEDRPSAADLLESDFLRIKEPAKKVGGDPSRQMSLTNPSIPHQDDGMHRHAATTIPNLATMTPTGSFALAPAAQSAQAPAPAPPAGHVSTTQAPAQAPSTSQASAPAPATQAPVTAQVTATPATTASTSASAPAVSVGVAATQPAAAPAPATGSVPAVTGAPASSAPLVASSSHSDHSTTGSTMAAPAAIRAPASLSGSSTRQLVEGSKSLWPAAPPPLLGLSIMDLHRKLESATVVAVFYYENTTNSTQSVVARPVKFKVELTSSDTSARNLAYEMVAEKLAAPRDTDKLVDLLTCALWSVWYTPSLFTQEAITSAPKPIAHLIGIDAEMEEDGHGYDSTHPIDEEDPTHTDAHGLGDEGGVVHIPRSSRGAEHLDVTERAERRSHPSGLPSAGHAHPRHPTLPYPGMPILPPGYAYPYTPGYYPHGQYMMPMAMPPRGNFANPEYYEEPAFGQPSTRRSALGGVTNEEAGESDDSCDDEESHSVGDDEEEEYEHPNYPVSHRAAHLSRQSSGKAPSPTRRTRVRSSMGMLGFPSNESVLHAVPEYVDHSEGEYRPHMPGANAARMSKQHHSTSALRQLAATGMQPHSASSGALSRERSGTAPASYHNPHASGGAEDDEARRAAGDNAPAASNGPLPSPTGPGLDLTAPLSPGHLPMFSTSQAMPVQRASSS